jgi:hypothetical protein
MITRGPWEFRGQAARIVLEFLIAGTRRANARSCLKSEPMQRGECEREEYQPERFIPMIECLSHELLLPNQSESRREGRVKADPGNQRRDVVQSAKGSKQPGCNELYDKSPNCIAGAVIKVVRHK